MTTYGNGNQPGVTVTTQSGGESSPAAQAYIEGEVYECSMVEYSWNTSGYVEGSVEITAHATFDEVFNRAGGESMDDPLIVAFENRDPLFIEFVEWIPEEYLAKTRIDTTTYWTVDFAARDIVEHK